MTQNTARRLVGYFPASAAIRRQNYSVAEIPADRLTPVIYAFASISQTGNLSRRIRLTTTAFPNYSNSSTRIHT
jgi:GH18 family chitinase